MKWSYVEIKCEINCKKKCILEIICLKYDNIGKQLVKN